MDMEKKNPYVTTIGFNRKDPNHVKVAELLNEMGRGKAQYIVNAVMAYHDTLNVNHISELDRVAIRKIIQELLEEEGYELDNSKGKHRDNKIAALEDEGERIHQLEENDILNIMNSLSTFRKR